MIRAIIWDIGGVLWRVPDPFVSRRWEDRLGLPAGKLGEIIFGNPIALQASIGKAYPIQVWARIGQMLNLSPPQTDRIRREIWDEGVWDEELLTEIQTLKANYKTGVISDAWLDARESVQQWVNADLFDEIMFSAEEGIKKPNPEIYHRMLSRLEIEPNEAVFIDDWLESVESASAIGMHAIHFVDKTTLKNELKGLI